MYVDFEIAAHFPSLYSRVKKSANFKTNIHLDSVESFLYYLSSSCMLMIVCQKITKNIEPLYQPIDNNQEKTLLRKVDSDSRQ